jgi:hypothetical protein
MLVHHEQKGSTMKDRRRTPVVAASMSLVPRCSLSGAVGSAVALTSCALPSADISTTNTPAPTEESRSKTKAKAQRKSAAPRRGPMVIDAELLADGKHLRLQLSEPVTPTDGVDPNDFRLSMAMAYAYRFYAYAYYYDLGELGDTGELLNILNIHTLQAQPDTLELEVDQFIDPAYCAELQHDIADMQEPGIRADGGIFLHYAPGERAITDSDGNQMAAFAAEWVLHRRRGSEEAYEMYIEGPAARRALREPVRVRCGPELPPGPR